MFELSSPFLNIHWFCDKLGLTGSIYQLINGFVLIATFFGCRLIWGTYSSVLVFKDIFAVYANPPLPLVVLPEGLQADGPLAADGPFVGKEVPLWLAVVYLGSNLLLNALNYYWFSRMIQTVAARFRKKSPSNGEAVGKGAKQASDGDGDDDDKVWVEGTDVDLATAAEVASMRAEELRKRLNVLKN